MFVSLRINFQYLVTDQNRGSYRRDVGGASSRGLENILISLATLST